MQLKDGNRNGLQMAKSICVIPGIADLILLNMLSHYFYSHIRNPGLVCCIELDVKSEHFLMQNSF